jgi:hypothetical protein
MLLLLLQVDRGNLGTPRADAQESGGKCLNPGIRVSGTCRTPRSWSGPVSNDSFPLGFTQSIGTYGTTLTFTLSTLAP